MSLVHFDMLNYASHTIVAGLSIYLYNIFVDKRGYRDIINLYDVGVMSASVLASKLTKDVISDVLGISKETIQFSLIEPTLNAFIYSYAYKFIVRDKYNSFTNRSNNMSMILGALIPIIASYSENPLSALIGNFKQF